MKFIKVICCIIAICLTFTGCSFSIASSIDDLLSPVAPFGDNASVQKAMDEYVNCSYSLKTPTYGDYITSYIFKDIDGDEKEEALCFYEPSDSLGNIFMALLVNNGKDWNVAYSIKGDGKDVYSVNFSDIDGNAALEIITCWDTISKSTTHHLSIYKVDNIDSTYSISQIDRSIDVNNYLCVDFDGDNKQEIITVMNDSNNSAAAKCQLYSINSDRFNMIGETKLDGHITNYTKLSTDYIDGKVRVYADAINSTGDSMLTEIIFWSDKYNTIVSPFYSYSSGFTKGTNRSAMVNSMDIDNDGLVEVPLDTYIDSLPESIKAVDWKNYKNTVLVHSNYSLFVKDDMYLIRIPDDMFDKVSINYDNETRALSVSDKTTNGLLYTITPVLKSLYSEEKYSGYDLIMENNGYYYLATLGENSTLDTQQLKDLIKSY